MNHREIQVISIFQELSSKEKDLIPAGTLVVPSIGD